MNGIEILKGLSPETLSDHAVRRLHGARNIAQANIDLIEVQGKPFVLKHFFHHSFLARTFWGRYVIGREWRNYQILQGLEGIPRIYRRVDPYSLIMEYVEGDRLPHLKDARLTPEFFERLKILVATMHARGVTHGDLRRKNILITREQRPYLIDFAGAFHIRGKGNFITRALFRRLKKVDDITVLKLQNHYLPDSLTNAEFSELRGQPWYLRLGQFLKKKVYRPFKHATRGRSGKRKAGVERIKKD